MTTITLDSMVQRWTDPKARPLFKGSLIDDDGCKSAQGDVLACAGWTDGQLRELSQNNADMEVAKVLGISTAHAILLRGVNDKKDGCPQDVLAAPEKILGDQAGNLLAFWLHLDRMTGDDWEKVAAARDAAGAAAWAAAWTAAWAANEIQGAAIMRKQGQPFFFLPMFGINDPEDAT